MTILVAQFIGNGRLHALALCGQEAYSPRRYGTALKRCGHSDATIFKTECSDNETDHFESYAALRLAALFGNE
jgi:hypothetical protein